MVALHAIRAIDCDCDAACLSGRIVARRRRCHLDAPQSKEREEARPLSVAALVAGAFGPNTCPWHCPFPAPRARTRTRHTLGGQVWAQARVARFLWWLNRGPHPKKKELFAGSPPPPQHLGLPRHAATSATMQASGSTYTADKDDNHADGAPAGREAASGRHGGAGQAGAKTRRPRLLNWAEAGECSATSEGSTRQSAWAAQCGGSSREWQRRASHQPRLDGAAAAVAGGFAVVRLASFWLR